MGVRPVTSKIIDMKGIACRSGSRYLIKDITWQVEAGQHWLIFGMNGSGKTTLLSVLAGWKHFAQGEVEVLGQHYDNTNILSLRRRVGLVSSSFFDRYYNRESAINIVLSGKFGTLGLDGAISDADIKLAKRLLGELHLADKVNYAYDKMSRGERQSVLIARALFGRPELLLLDEPCSGLDIYNREHLLSTVRDLADCGLTIIYVTHYTDEILDIFQKCLLLKRGRIYAQGDTNALFQAETMSAFLDHPTQVTRVGDQLRLEMTATSQINKLLYNGVRK